MSKNLSAIKKTRIGFRNYCRNKIYKSAIKTLTKKYLSGFVNTDIYTFDYNQQLKKLAVVYQKIDKAVKKGALHKNSGARKKALLAKEMKKYFYKP